MIVKFLWVVSLKFQKLKIEWFSNKKGHKTNRIKGFHYSKLDDRSTVCVICVKRHFDKKIKITKNVLHMVVTFLPMVLMLVDQQTKFELWGGRRSSRRWSIQDLTSSALPLSFLYVSKNQGVQKAQPKTIILKICETPNGVNGGKSHDTVPVYLLVLPDGSAEIWIHKGDILACQCSLTVNFPYTYHW